MPKYTMERRNPKSLKDHKLSIKTYGPVSPSKDFLDSIDPEIGIIEPLIILPCDTIISGHNRKYGAIQKGLTEVVCIVRHDLEDQPLLVESMVIMSNRQRVKTNEVLAKEAAALAEIEGKAAAARRKLGLWVNGQPPEILVKAEPPEPEKKQQTRRVVGHALGVGDKKAEQLIKVGQAMEAASEVGDIKTADELSETVNRSVPEAAKIADQFNQQQEKPVTTQPDNKPKNDKPIKLELMPVCKKTIKALKDFFPVDAYETAAVTEAIESLQNVITVLSGRKK